MQFSLRIIWIAFGFLISPLVANTGWVVWKQHDAQNWSAEPANVISFAEKKNAGTSKAGWSIEVIVRVGSAENYRTMEIVDYLTSEERMRLANGMRDRAQVDVWTHRASGENSVFAPVVPRLYEDFILFLPFFGVLGAFIFLLHVGERVHRI